MNDSGWRITRFESGAAFLDRAVSFLTEYEAHNCLLLGIAAQLRDYPERQLAPAYLAVAADGDRIGAAAVMTPPNGVVLAMSSQQAAVEALVPDVHAFRPQLPGAVGPVPVSGWFVDVWLSLTGDTATLTMERVYQLTRVRPQRPVAGTVRRASAADRALLREWLTEFQIEAFGEPPTDIDWRIDTMLAVSHRGMYLWEVDGQPVSLAGFAGPTPNGIRIGPVYTPRPLRGRGYASACVARLSQDKLAEGRQYCFLFTDLGNPTSNHIYQDIGYEPVSDVVNYHFRRPAAPG